MLFQVKEAKNLKTLAEIGKLRAIAWRQEESIKFFEFGNSDCWLEPLDLDAFHWTVYHDGELIAAARLSIHDSLDQAPYAGAFSRYHIKAAGPFASINRLVVKKPYQGQGISKALDQLRIRAARKFEASSIVAIAATEARCHALMKAGYKPYAQNVNPASLGIHLANTEVSVLMLDLASEQTSLLSPQILHPMIASYRPQYEPIHQKLA